MALLFAEAIEAFDHWVAFGLLVIIGINMLKEALEKEDESGDGSEKDADLSVRTCSSWPWRLPSTHWRWGFPLPWSAASTSGWRRPLRYLHLPLSALGVKIGNVFGSRYEKKAELAGGVILILLGVKILLEHLGVLT